MDTFLFTSEWENEGHPDKLCDYPESKGFHVGYATDETPELMPLSHVLATKLGSHLTQEWDQLLESWNNKLQKK
ncbi:hypothetical protein VNO78_18251 [Psophocarpus tetragonolobus]|uniref:S-adenosylmethionine synthetase central domain-containing protein n=1 Tax=Psophocarpus tetragonolobus TaxID=3891 RepID=A0AAN9SK84_PSOTE